MENGSAIVEFRGVSKWYGDIIGVNNLTVSIFSGVTGLLGPNGAGKSTFLQLATGQIRPNQGEVFVLGHPVGQNPDLYRYIGLCPEQDAFYEWMTGREFVEYCARLGGLSRSDSRLQAARAIAEVQLTAAADRAIRGYSKGMRQRIKLAQCLVHEPLVLFLDEPFSGTDPVARAELVEVIRGLAAAGKSIILSSHVLHEVETMTPRIVLINHGRLVAEGLTRELRSLIDGHPHRIILKSANDRLLAAKLVAFEDVVGVEVSQNGDGILVKSRAPDKFYSRLAEIALDPQTLIQHVESSDDNLEAVFRYLVR